jgi:hydroxyacylglutathione hydrolase
VSRIDGYLGGGMRAWEAAGLPTGCFPTMTTDEFHAAATRGEAPLVIDVRTGHEWNTGHIEGAMHIALGELAKRSAEIPRERGVATICESGYRSALAASVLARAGVDRVSNITGGMTALRQLRSAQGSAPAGITGN